MNRDQHRTFGKSDASATRAYALTAAVTFAIALGYFVVTSGMGGDSRGHAPPSPVDCVPGVTGDARQARGCDAVVPDALAGTPSSQAPDTKTRAAAAAGEPAVTDAAPARHAVPPRAWQNDTRTENSLRPGYTMAEICQAAPANRELRCRAAGTGELVAADDRVRGTAPARESLISGRVLTAEGAGVAGVAIVASPERLSAGPARNAGRLRFWTVSDTLGGYELDGLPDGEYTVRSAAHGSYRPARISARTGVSYADIVVRPADPIVFSGQILSETREPLEGVLVTPVVLGQAGVRSGYDGHFRLPVSLPPETARLELRFRSPGFAEQTARLEPALAVANELAGMTIVMAPVAAWTSVSGRVVGAGGGPLAGRTVELRANSSPRSDRVTTNDAGRFEFPMVEAPADYRLVAFGGEGHADVARSLHVTVDSDELELVVPAYEFGALTGRLVDIDGAPVPDFELVLRNTRSQRPSLRVSTDASGNFEIPDVPAGQLVLASQSNPAMLVQGLRLEPGERLFVPLVLDWGGHELHGLVVDSAGNPVPATRIVLGWSHETDGVTTRAIRRTAADSLGQFAFSNLGPGPHSLRVDAPGFATLRMEHDMNRQGYDLMVRLDRGNPPNGR